MSDRRRVGRVGPALVGLMLAAACNDHVAPARHCVGHDQCDSGFMCGPDNTCIVAAPCEVDAACCPGAVCFSGFCRPTIDCGEDRVCERLGHVCEAGRCVPSACEAPEDCAEPFACVAGRCLDRPPCGGACGAGAACDVGSGRCLSATCAPCAAGWPVVAATPALTALTCGPDTFACACGLRPSVPGGHPGVDGQLAVLDGEPRLVSYEPTYGDLVLTAFGPRTDHVLDGAPTVTPIAGPETSRGGVFEDGPDRGMRPALAAAAPGDAEGAWDVLYRDADGGKVLHLRFDPSDGRRVAGSVLPVEGDAGRYACLVRRQVSGESRLSGLVFVSSDRTGSVSRLVRVDAKVESPASTDDWEFGPVLEVPLPVRSATPCAGACAFGELCVLGPSGETCAQAINLQAATCGGCEPHELCTDLDDGAGQACRARVYQRYAADRLPFGSGLFVSCAARPSGGGDDAVVAAWYDADHKTLVGGRWPFGASDRWIVETAGTDRRDPGRHTGIAVSPSGRIAIAYQDAVSERLRVAEAAQMAGPWTISEVDQGGAWAHPAWLGNDAIAVGHGDTVKGHIRVSARAANGCWASIDAFSGGGFAFGDLAVDRDTGGAATGDVWVSALAYAFATDLSPEHAPVVMRLTPPSCAP